MPSRTGSLRLTIPTAFVSAILGAGGIAGLLFVALPSSLTRASEEMIALREIVKNHCGQSEKNWLAQTDRDQKQDLHTESVSDGVDMLTLGLSGIDVKVGTLQSQMTEVQRDIKELLRRQALRGTQ